jgi:ribonuclease R
MKDRVGEKFHGMVTALVGSGAYVALDDPFADVLMRYEDMGGNWEVDDDGLRASSGSGQVLALGDRVELEIIDVSIVRRTVYGRIVGGDSSHRRDAKRGRQDRPRRDQRQQPQRQQKQHRKGGFKKKRRR